MAKKFTRTVENFTCEHCEREVEGNGYTNHCPNCLWSKHVDKNPGDRLEACIGLMEPVMGEKDGKNFMITHKCIKCGFERRNSFKPGDNFDVFINLSKKLTGEI